MKLVALRSKIMENLAVTTATLQKKDPLVNSTFNSPDSVSSDVQAVPILDKFLFLIEPVMDYAFGIFMGYILGWLAGLRAGFIYVEHYEPVYFETISLLSKWRLMPYEFAKNGAVIGIVAGIIAITIINRTLLNRKIISESNAS
jgi:hypothetical protein